MRAFTYRGPLSQFLAAAQAHAAAPDTPADRANRAAQATRRHQERQLCELRLEIAYQHFPLP